MKFLSAPIRYQIMMLVFAHDDDGVYEHVCVCVYMFGLSKNTYVQNAMFTEVWQEQPFLKIL